MMHPARHSDEDDAKLQVPVVFMVGRAQELEALRIEQKSSS